jgi:hypothetical protein
MTLMISHLMLVRVWVFCVLPGRSGESFNGRSRAICFGLKCCLPVPDGVNPCQHVLLCDIRTHLHAVCHAGPTAPRKGFEQVLRKLLRLPSRPLVVVLHHYAWWFAVQEPFVFGDPAGLFWKGAEMQLTQYAQVHVCVQA